MANPEAKPGPRDGSTPLMITLAGLIVGLALFILFGTETSRYGVIPFVVGGLAVGGLLAILLRRHRSHRF